MLSHSDGGFIKLEQLVTLSDFVRLHFTELDNFTDRRGVKAHAFGLGVNVLNIVSQPLFLFLEAFDAINKGLRRWPATPPTSFGSLWPALSVWAAAFVFGWFWSVIFFSLVGKKLLGIRPAFRAEKPFQQGGEAVQKHGQSGGLPSILAGAALHHKSCFITHEYRLRTLAAFV